MKQTYYLSTYLLLGFLLNSCCSLQNNDSFTIALSKKYREPNFLISVGRDCSLEKAAKNAQRKLAEQITVKVESTFNWVIAEWKKELTEEVYSQLSTSSNVALWGAETVLEDQKDDQYYVVLKLNREHQLLEKAKHKKPPPFEINYLYSASGQFKTLHEGSVLHSGDHYKLIFEPIENSYVYIFQIDSAHKIFRLFPTDEYSNADPKNQNPVQQGEQYFVPAEHHSFELDNQTGKETIYVIVTQQPDLVLENQYQQLKLAQETGILEQRRIARQKWQETLELRGPTPALVDDVTQTNTWEENGQQSVFSQYLGKMCDGCVHILNFQHQ